MHEPEYHDPCPGCDTHPKRWDMVTNKFPPIAKCTDPDCRVKEYKA